MTTNNPAVVASFITQLEQTREANVAEIAPRPMEFVGPLNAATSYLAGRVA